MNLKRESSPSPAYTIIPVDHQVLIAGTIVIILSIHVVGLIQTLVACHSALIWEALLSLDERVIKFYTGSSVVLCSLL